MASDSKFSTVYSMAAYWWELWFIIVLIYCGDISIFDEWVDDTSIHNKLVLIGAGKEHSNKLKQTGLEDAKDFVQKVLTKASRCLGQNESFTVKSHK